VIEMKMRVDQARYRTPEGLFEGCPEAASQILRLLGIDSHRSVGRSNRAGIRIAVDADPSINAGPDFDQRWILH
jgi:hypothetical protein